MHAHACVCVSVCVSFWDREHYSLGIYQLSRCKVMGVRTGRAEWGHERRTSSEKRLRWGGPVLLAVFRLRSEIKWLTFPQDLLSLWTDDRFDMLLLFLIYVCSSVSMFWTWPHCITSLIFLSFLCFYFLSPLCYSHYTSQWFIICCFRFCLFVFRMTPLLR